MAKTTRTHVGDWPLLPPVSRQVQDVILEEAAPGLRILEILLMRGPGAIFSEERVRRLAQGLQARGHFVQVIYPDSLPRGLGRWRHWPANRASLANYDVIHIHARRLGPQEHRELLSLGCIIPEMRLRMVLSCYGSMNAGRDERQVRRLKNLALVLAHSLNDYESLRPHLPAEKLAYVPWGVELERFPPAPPENDGLHVIFLGFCSADEIMEEATQALHDVPGVIGHVLLPADMRPSLEHRAPAGVPNLHLEYAAGPEGIREYLRKGQVVVWPAGGEACCISSLVLETLAAGCLLVAPDSAHEVRGLAEQVGFLYPAGQPQALRQMLETLRDNPDLRRRYQELGRRRAALFPWEHTLDTCEQLLARVHLRRLISFALRRARSPEDLYTILLRQMVNMIGADGGSFFTSHPDGTLTVQAVYGRGPAPPRHVARYEGIYGFAADQRQTLLLPGDIRETYLEESWPVSDLRRSAVIVPVQYRGQLLGIAEAIRGFTRRPFEESHRRWFAWWAEAAGEALTAALARSEREGR
ncbi:MAG: GAF domain-containing protein [Anaerolineae bacterium]